MARTKYEYLQIRFKDNDDITASLNGLGKAGWQMVGSHIAQLGEGVADADLGFIFFFMRAR
jgi:hypothetical protein